MSTMKDELEERIREFKLQLTTFDKNEWRDVAMLLRPDWSEEDFVLAWEGFQYYKRRKGLH